MIIALVTIFTLLNIVAAYRHWRKDMKALETPRDLEVSVK